MVYEYLIEEYESGEPVFVGDIHISGMSEGNLRYHLKKLTDEGKICRFDSGVYYLPKTNLLGECSVLTADMVAIHKYIRRREKWVGYFSGYTLANRMGLSSQVPFTEEIVSNYAPAPIREIKNKNRKYTLRRPVVEVNDENVFVLEFLDCLKDLEKCAEADFTTCGAVLTEFADRHHITKQDIDRFIGYYPLRIYKALYETGVKYVSA